jgi:hypothetical protein
LKYKGHNPKVDANQAVIVRELRDRGALVVILGQPVDLLVGYNGTWCLVEVKASPRSNIRPSQRAFLDQCQKFGVPCILMDDLDDCDYWFPLRPADSDNRDSEGAGNEPGGDKSLSGTA